MVSGILVTMVMPLLVQVLGVGAGAQMRWFSVMSALSAVVIPAALMEYFFTRERVTEENVRTEECAVSFGAQVRACLRSRSWLSAMLLNAGFILAASLSSASMLYFCNWVLGDSIAGGAVKQILVNAIGQAPMGLGVVLLWPLVRRFGKQKVTLAGSILAVMGCLMVLHADRSMPLVLAGLLIKSVGTLPTYVLTAHLADAMDDVERRCGFRTDGFSASALSILHTVAPGLSQTILLWGMNRFGYLAPSSAAQVLVQNPAVQQFFSWCFAGLPMLCFAACVVCMMTGR